MGFWEWLMFRRWPKPEVPASLTLDLEAARLGRIGLGDPAQVLAETLGAPASYWDMRNQRWWVYPQLGLSFQTEAEQISYIAIVLAQLDYAMPPSVLDQLRPFSGLVRFKHGPERPSQLQESSFTKVFGEPFWSDRDSEETVLHFRHGKVVIEAEFTPAGVLKHLALFPADDAEEPAEAG
jgi:hypothetical protein